MSRHWSLSRGHAEPALFEDLLGLESFLALLAHLGLVPSKRGRSSCPSVRARLWLLLRTGGTTTFDASLHLLVSLKKLTSQVRRILAAARGQFARQGLVRANVVRGCRAFEHLLKPRNADAEPLIQVVSVIEFGQVDELGGDLT